MVGLQERLCPWHINRVMKGVFVYAKGRCQKNLPWESDTLISCLFYIFVFQGHPMGSPEKENQEESNYLIYLFLAKIKCVLYLFLVVTLHFSSLFYCFRAISFTLHYHIKAQPSHSVFFKKKWFIFIFIGKRHCLMCICMMSYINISISSCLYIVVVIFFILI